MKTRMALFALFGVLVITSCSLFGNGLQTDEPSPQDNQGEPTAGNAEIANPASVYCIDQGYSLELRTNNDGGMYGVCVFPDGSECEEWAYFHGECAPGGEQGGTELSPDISIPDGWQTYTNERNGYQISYPPESSILTTGVMGYPTDDLPEGSDPDEFLAQLEAQYGDDLCLTINYNHGYITLLPDWENSIKYSACGRTGVGAGEMLDTSAVINVNGQAYTAEGFEWHGSGNQEGEVNETLIMILSDGTRITFGGPLDASVSFDQYLTDTRGVLISIIETYSPHN